MSVAPLTGLIIRQLQLDSGIDGVLVTQVAGGSAAERAGLRQADIIQRMGNIEVVDPGDYYRALSAGQRLQIEALRGGEATLELTMRGL
jgi:S1-C subfamily serine protease